MNTKKTHLENLEEYKEYALESLRQFFIRLDPREKHFHVHNDFELTEFLVEDLFDEIETVKHFFDLHGQYRVLLRDYMNDCCNKEGET